MSKNLKYVRKNSVEHFLVQATPETNPGSIQNSENCTKIHVRVLFEQFAPLILVGISSFSILGFILVPLLSEY